MKHTRYYILLLGIIGLTIPHIDNDDEWLHSEELEEYASVDANDIATHINIDTNTNLFDENNPTWLTIFVHGTFLVNPRLLFGSLAPLVNDTIQDTMYARTILFARKNTIFYQNQAMQELGLKKIMPGMVKQGYASGALARLFDQVTDLSSSEKTNNYYYTFGWSGLISSTIRTEEACIFYNQLAQEIHQFKEKGINPHVRIIAYSHGGNVALGIAHADNNYQLSIDELILLGMPVIAETEDLIDCPIFKKIYNIFSESDHIQASDFFSYPHSFSKRTFEEKYGNPLPKKLVQIQLRMKTHKVLQCSGNAPLRFRKKKSPGHFELWFFGWTPHYYRKTFPFYPIPVVAYLPWILNAVEESTPQNSTSPLLTVSINPTDDLMTIAHACSSHAKYKPFLSSEVRSQLKDMMIPYKPVQYSIKYMEQKKKSYAKALAVHRFTKRPFFCNVEMSLKT